MQIPQRSFLPGPKQRRTDGGLSLFSATKLSTLFPRKPIFTSVLTAAQWRCEARAYQWQVSLPLWAFPTILQSTQNKNATKGQWWLFWTENQWLWWLLNCCYSCAGRRKCVAAIECSCGESVGILRMFRIAPIPIPSESDIVGIPNSRHPAE